MTKRVAHGWSTAPRFSVTQRLPYPNRHVSGSIARLISTAAFFAVVVANAEARPLYVDDNAPSGGDGTSWTTAFRHLQDALAVVVTGDEIRVAGGTYKPDQRIVSGRITNWGESGPVMTIGDGTNHVSLWWSFGALDLGWFYGSDYKGDSDVALAPGVTDVTQIADASIYSFNSGGIGPFCDADCDPDGVGEFIVWRNVETGHYGVLRIDSIHSIDVEPFVALDATWWFQMDGTGNFVPDRRATFQLKNGVALLGGYAGLGAPDTDLRDVVLYESVLSGDLNGDDGPQRLPEFIECFGATSALPEPGCVAFDYDVDSDVDLEDRDLYLLGNHYSDNSYHVVVASLGSGDVAILDGFTITAGNANGVEYSESIGGGMYIWQGNPTVANCTFIANSAKNYGGGMSIQHLQTSPTVNKCVFRANVADVGGGLVIGGGRPIVTHCNFAANAASAGGGMFNYGGDPAIISNEFRQNKAYQSGAGMANTSGGGLKVDNCTFVGNTAGWSGGGLWTASGDGPVVTRCVFCRNAAYLGGGMSLDGGNGDPTVTSCTFIGNTAFGGGGLINISGNPRVTNCTFYGNVSISEGGGLYDYDGISTANSCVFWANADQLGTDEWAQILGYGHVTYSDIQEGRLWLLQGTGNLSSDPLFVDANGPDDILGTPDDNLRLGPGSPCINAGDPAVLFVPGETDLDGHARVLCGRVDIGAYEFGIGDYKCDEDVDPVDFANWAACLTGPNNGPFRKGCEAFDFDGDMDVDLEDFDGFQRAFMGG